MVVKTGCYGVGNDEKQEDHVNINGNNRRRRVMDTKFSFRRKKKSRRDSGRNDAGDTNGGRSHVAKHHHNNNDMIQKNSELKPKRSFFAKLFYFKRDRRRSDFSETSKNKSKSVECIEPERYVEACNQIAPSNDLQSKGNYSCLENGYHSKGNVARTDMSISISSPNLTTVKWPSFENVDETINRGKYSSFRRSRASMIFPVETLNDICNGIDLSHSERQLEQTACPNTNNKIYSGSCLHKEIDEKSHFTAESVSSRNTPNGEYLSRTNDGRSPHPRRRNPCYETFSSPNIFNENETRVIRTKLYQFTSSENVAEYKCHGLEEDPTLSTEAHPVNRNTSEAREGYENDDFVFVMFGRQNAIETKCKKLSRYISCPSNLETESSTGRPPSSFPFCGSTSKPYSSHRRPYSVHESVMSLDVLEVNDRGVIIERRDEEEDNSEFPPDDNLNLPSKVILTVICYLLSVVIYRKTL